MTVHGVDETEHVRLSNMKTLYEQVKLAEKIINYRPAAPRLPHATANTREQGCKRFTAPPSWRAWENWVETKGDFL